MRIALFALCVVVALCAAPTALAWGPVGHAVVASIAQNMIKSSTWNAIQSINGGGVALAAVASQPDAYDHTEAGRWSGPLHYVNLPEGATKYGPGDCRDNFCVVGAITNYTAQSRVLPRKPWPYFGDSSQPSPITFLVHFIGDVHQPLHAGWGKDRGGNSVTCTWFGSKSNLHKVWDSGMISHSGFSIGGLTAELMNYINSNPSVVSGWRSQTSVAEWANESFQYVRNNVYNFGPAGSNMALGKPYYDANWPIVRMRIAAAGVRLAALLDNIFA